MCDNMSLHTLKYFVTPVSCFKAFSKWGNWGKMKMRGFVHGCSVGNFGSQATVGTIRFIQKNPGCCFKGLSLFWLSSNIKGQHAHTEGTIPGRSMSQIRWWERWAEFGAWASQSIAQARHRRVAFHQRAQAEESRCMRHLEWIELSSMMTELFSV